MINKPPTDLDDPLLDSDLALVMRIFSEKGFTCHQDEKSPYFFRLRKDNKPVGEALVDLKAGTLWVASPGKTILHPGANRLKSNTFYLADPQSIPAIHALIAAW
jgi:hypothetical protein